MLHIERIFNYSSVLMMYNMVGEVGDITYTLYEGFTS